MMFFLLIWALTSLGFFALAMSMSKTQRVSPSAVLTNLALAGNAEAQFELAELYMQSEHDDDIILAEEWALKAANG
ncbi:hypothetical protein, partial [Klebsiella pneumoniae]|uniref:hypothetical protein n=1 Tax=Klebsiella pneumoniae TaxID=573 RepID=UPI001C4DF3FF